MTKKLYFIHKWLKCKNPFYLFIILFHSNSFYSLPIIQWHQVLLWCCHIQTMSRLVNCCRRTEFLSSFICFNYFCWVTMNAQLRRKSFTVVTVSRENDEKVTLLHSSIPTDFGQQQWWDCTVLSRKRQVHPKILTVSGMEKGGARTVL